MPMTSANATTLKVRSAISVMREEEGPHGSLEVASRTCTTAKHNPVHFYTCTIPVKYTYTSLAKATGNKV